MNMPSFIIDLASSLIKIRDRRSEHVKRASDFESREYLGVMNEDPKLNWMTFLAFFFVCSLWLLMDDSDDCTLRYAYCNFLHLSSYHLCLISFMYSTVHTLPKFKASK